MGDGDLKRGGLGRIKQVRDEIASRGKKVRFEADMLLDVDRLIGHAQFCELIDKLLLHGVRKIETRLRAQVGGKKILIVIHGHSLDRLPAKRMRFSVHGVLVVKEPPNPAADNYEKDNYNDQALA